MSVISQQYSALLFRDQPASKPDDTPDWSKVSSQDWERLLTLLSEDAIDPQLRKYWMTAMRAWIKTNIQPTEVPAETATINFSSVNRDYKSVQRCFPLMRAVAYKLCDWGLIIHLHKVLTALYPQKENEPVGDLQTIEYLQLSVAHWQMGFLAEADQFLRSKHALLPENSPLYDFHFQIDQDIKGLSAEYSELIDGDLQIFPLQEQHSVSFSWVYHDPQIAKLCNLPEFDAEERWFDWLEGNQANPNATLFAVNHREWGLIGSVFLAVHNGVGFFYYWLGQDFQGKGFGPRAVNLLLQFGKEHREMQGCYAKVFDDNIASQQAMKKIGFYQLPFKVAAPQQNELYFYLGAEQEQQTQGEELQLLTKALNFNDKIIY